MKTKIKSLALLALPLLTSHASAYDFDTGPITWSLWGQFDVGLRNTHHGDSTLSRTTFLSSNTVTTLLIGQASIKLGNGFNGIFLEELDHDPSYGNKQNQGVPSNVYSGSPFQGQQYVGLTSPWGSIKLGVPNSWGLYAGSIATPFGTGNGSAYDSTTNYSRLGSSGVTGVSNYVGNGNRVVRHERSAVYETNVYSGFSGAVEYSPGNDNAADGSANNDNRWLAAGLQYQLGNARAILWHGQAKAGSNRAAGTTAPSATTQSPNVLAANQSVSFTILSGNYLVLPALRLYAGYSLVTTSNDVENTRAANVGAKYTMGSFDFLGDYLVRGGNRGANAAAANQVPKSHMLGLGVDYRFGDSSANAIYWRLQDVNHVDAAGHALRTNSIGIRLGF